MTDVLQMHVALLGPASSIHLQRWANALVARDLRVTLITQHSAADHALERRVSVVKLPFHGSVGYLLNALPLRRLLGRLGPSILNVHYASGYGTLAATAGFAPTLLSIWGSDVYEFPTRSWLRRQLLRWNVGRATAIASTSRAMADQLAVVVPRAGREVFITPFGVDLHAFAPTSVRSRGSAITVGTVKTLAKTYGIDTLIDAFALLTRSRSGHSESEINDLRLVIVGDGPDRDSLVDQARRRGIEDSIDFVGAVQHREVPDWLNKFAVYVAVSRSESFGVSVIEASASGIPVVVSNAGGLPEVVRHGITGLVVPKEDPEALAQALRVLLSEGDLRIRMGKAGRQFVEEHYDWDHCVDRMLACYRRTLELAQHA